ncbi:MAG: hypothetical protein AAGA75_10760 [Cyanobacteria bacterium P01_E01_bin.6]
MLKALSCFLRKQGTPLLIPSAIGLTCFVGVIVTQVPQLNEILQESRSPSLEQIQRQEASTRLQLDLLKRFPSLGFNNLIANWVFLDFIQYFGNVEVRQKTDYRLSPEFFDVILALDPYFRDGYFFLSSSASLFAGMPERTVEIIERELPRLSPTTPEKAAYILRYKGTDELLFLADSASAKESFELAAEWASVYDDDEGASIALVSRRMADFLEGNPDSRYAQISAWVMVYYNAFDGETKQLAVQRIRNLGGQASIQEDGRLDFQLPPRD